MFVTSGNILSQFLFQSSKEFVFHFHFLDIAQPIFDIYLSPFLFFRKGVLLHHNGQKYPSSLGKSNLLN
jgi:hypothetical protein